MRMPLLDRAFYLLDSARSPQDFTLILDLHDLPDVDRFSAGAKSAMNRFPISACSVASGAWVWRENQCFKLAVVEGESRSAIERFIDEPFDLRREPPVKQLLLLSRSGGARLATRFHHAAADGLSAALWLGHQLNVAYEVEAVQLERGLFEVLSLRKSEASVRRSEFAYDAASDALRTSRSQRSGSRRWSTIDFNAHELQKMCRGAGGFTYHDLLATCALEVIAKWNNDCRGGPPWPPVVAQNGSRAATEGRPYNNGTRVALWVPMNVRREASVGFGNGTSRIHVYANSNRGASLIEKCRAVRQQVTWTTKHGEWMVPELPWLTRLPDSLAGPLLRGYLKLPEIDMATAVFTHASSCLTNAEAFKHVERIECVGLLHPRQNLAINAATHSGQTSLTLTYDPALLTTADAAQLTQLFSEQIVQARRELSPEHAVQISAADPRTHPVLI